MVAAGTPSEDGGGPRGAGRFRLGCMAKAKHAGVWLVRAGPTTWDEEGRIVGAADIPLSPAGMKAAAERATQVRGQVISAVLCGPEEAGIQTAKTIAEAVGAKVKPLAGLADVGLGLWEGVREDDQEDRCKTVFRQWKTDPGTVSVPGGESLESARDRMIDVFRKQVPKYGGAIDTLAIVLRPMALGLVRCWLEGRPTSELWALGTEGPGVERLTVDCGRLREKLALTAVRVG